jgi:hypothetical protein
MQIIQGLFFLASSPDQEIGLSIFNPSCEKECKFHRVLGMHTYAFVQCAITPQFALTKMGGVLPRCHHVAYLGALLRTFHLKPKPITSIPTVLLI